MNISPLNHLLGVFGPTEVAMNHPNMNMFDRVYVHTYIYFKIYPQISKVPLHIYQFSTILLLFDTHLGFPIMDNHCPAPSDTCCCAAFASLEGGGSFNEAIENQTK